MIDFILNLKSKNIKQFFLLLCIMFFINIICLYSANRTISGTIYNALSKNTISSIKIKIKGVEQGTISASNGQYTIQVPDTLSNIEFEDFEQMVLVEVKKINANTLDVYLGSDDMFNLSLEDLMNIKVITAGKKEQSINEIAASISVITKEEIQAYGYQSLEEIFENVIGFYKINDYKSVNFGVRGFFSNVYNRSIIFLINGVQQKLPDVDWNIFTASNLQVEAIEKIEIIKGPNAILYGNNAFFGAINVITKSGNESTNKKNVNLAYGTNNSTRANVNITLNNFQSKVNINAGYYKTDGLNEPFSSFLDSVQDYTKAFQKNANTKGFFAQNSHYFNLSSEIDNFYAKLSYDETTRNLIHSLKPILDTTKNTRDEQALRANIGWRKQLNPNLEMDINVGFVNFNLTNTYQLGSVTSIRRDMSINPSTGKEYFAKINAFVSINDDLKTSSGFEFNSVVSQTDFIVSPNSKVINNQKLMTPANLSSFFTQIDYNLSKDLSLIAGVRMDYLRPYTLENQYYQTSSIDTVKVYKVLQYSYNYERVNLTPKLAMIYKFDENNKILKLMYSRAKSRPSVYENVYVLNAPHSQLEPQEISTFELNYTMGWNKNIYINSSLFYNNLDNLISRENQIDSITRAVKIDASNGNKMETYGAEFQIIYKATSDLNIDASMSYQITKNKRLDIPGAYSPPLLLNLKVAYNLNENMIVAVNSYFVDKMESEYDTAPIDPVNGNYTSKGRIFQTTPSYINLGANFRYNNLFDSNMYLAIHCSNLLDNEIHFAPTLVNRAYLPKGTIGYGRAINATIGVNF